MFVLFTEYDPFPASTVKCTQYRVDASNINCAPGTNVSVCVIGPPETPATLPISTSPTPPGTVAPRLNVATNGCDELLTFTETINELIYVRSVPVTKLNATSPFGGGAKNPPGDGPDTVTANPCVPAARLSITTTACAAWLNTENNAMPINGRILDFIRIGSFGGHSATTSPPYSNFHPPEFPEKIKKPHLASRPLQTIGETPVCRLNHREK